MFKYKPGIDVNYQDQGYIYFTSLRYNELDDEAKAKIDRLCSVCGGEHSLALFEFVTTSDTATAICLRRYLSIRTLYRCVRRYYEHYFDEFIR